MVDHSGKVEITQEHIELAESIARNLGRTPMGQVAGDDELVSESFVALWDLALAWDPDRVHADPSFLVYVRTMMRRRLIDWLRHEHGRFSSTRSRSTIQQKSLEAMQEWSVPYEAPAAEPQPEDVAVDRDELARTFEAIDRLVPRQRDAILGQLRDPDDADSFRHAYGMTKNTAQVHRNHARRRLREVTGRSAP